MCGKPAVLLHRIIFPGRKQCTEVSLSCDMLNGWIGGLCPLMSWSSIDGSFYKCNLKLSGRLFLVWQSWIRKVSISVSALQWLCKTDRPINLLLLPCQNTELYELWSCVIRAIIVKGKGQNVKLLWWARKKSQSKMMYALALEFVLSLRLH